MPAIDWWLKPRCSRPPMCYFWQLPRSGAQVRVRGAPDLRFQPLAIRGDVHRHPVTAMPPCMWCRGLIGCRHRCWVRLPCGRSDGLVAMIGDRYIYTFPLDLSEGNPDPTRLFHVHTHTHACTRHARMHACTHTRVLHARTEIHWFARMAA